MTRPLLETKFYIPPARPQLAPRPLLIQRLTAGLDRKLTLISAPAGFGKTTLLSVWADQCQWPVAWLSLDRDDNNPRQFLTYLIAALERVCPKLGTDARALLQFPQVPSFKAVLTMLINGLVKIETRLVLVLDDYHVIKLQSIHDGLAFLLGHLPPQMHLILSGRVDPPLPLARLRTRGYLHELRGADLRFTLQEAALFLNQVMGLQLSEQDVATLESRTEGWIAGLQLAALSMRGRETNHVADFIAAFSGSHRHVIDYLVEEVLAQQPDRVRTFLCQTAVLDRLTASLCDAVTGYQDSASILRYLEQANMFLVPLDDRREWYRYHLLFADFLRNRLQHEMPDRVHDLHCWAAEWYEKRELFANTIDHVLQAAEFEWAARLLGKIALRALVNDQAHTLLRWLSAFPQQMIDERPQLCIFYAWALIIIGELDDVEKYLGYAEKNFRSEDWHTSAAQERFYRELVGQVTAARAYLAIYKGDWTRSANLAHQAMTLLPRDDPFLHGVANWLVEFTQFFQTDVSTSDNALARTIELGEASGNVLIALLSIYMSGYFCVFRGDLCAAQRLFERGLRMVERSTMEGYVADQDAPPLSVCLVYQGLGNVARERNDLVAAARHLSKCIELAEKWGNAEVLVDSYIFWALTRQAQGDVETANHTMERVERLVQEDKVAPFTARQVRAYRTKLCTLQGDLDAAAQHADVLEDTEIQEPIDIVPLLMLAIEKAALARFWLAQGRFQAVIDLLQPLYPAVEDAGWMGVVLEMLAIQALALQGLSRAQMALDVLHRALALAQPQRYVCLFVDLGPKMCALLRQAVSHGVVPDYACTLLAAFEAEQAAVDVSAVSQPVDMVEPLSEREREVLQLIAAGLTNREIAERLFIAVSTVKSHINSLYRKLDVSKRTQAVARAREWRLL